MKEKVMEVLKNKKLIGGVIAAIVAMIVVILLLNVIFSSKPKKYEEKIKNVVKALSSESKMKDAIDDKLIDIKGAAAWMEADQEAEDFKKEYKDLKKDSDEIEEMEDGLKELAKSNEELEREYKVKNIKEPKKDKDNKKIYSVTATLVTEGGYYDSEQQIKVIFYKGKVVDIISKDYDSSLFESAVKANK